MWQRFIDWLRRLFMPESFFGNRTRERTNATVINQYATYGDLPNASGLAIGTRAYVVGGPEGGKFYDVTEAGWVEVGNVQEKNDVEVAYATGLDADGPIDFTLTYDGSQNYMAILVRQEAIAAPGPDDFAGLWMEIPDGFIAHRENRDNPHQVAYDQVIGPTAGEPVEVITKAEAETGTSETPRWFTAKRIADAIRAIAGTSGQDSVGSIFDVRQLTEQNGVWVNPLGEAAERDWDNPTHYLSTGSPAVPPPLNADSGMRENLDHYERVNEAAPVALVVANPAAPTAVDTAIQTRIQELGAAVTMIAQEDPVPADNDYVVAVIAESVGGGLNAAWDTSGIPIVLGEVTQMDTFRLIDADTSTNDDETTDGLAVAANGHEAIGDIVDGTLTVYTAVGSYSHAAVAGLPAGATVLGEKLADAARTTVAVFEQGAGLTTGTAPARRVFMGHLYRADLWNVNGRELFDGLLYWAAGWSY